MNREQVIALWASNNILGTKYKERYSGSAFWFRGNVLFKHDRPQARLEQSERGWMLLEENEFWPTVIDPRANEKRPDENYSDYHLRCRLPFLRLDTIGVHTCHPGDLVPSGAELHQHMHNSSKRALDFELEAVREVSMTTLNHWYGDKMQFRKVYIDNIYTRWDEYRVHFDPDLPALPDIYPERDRILTAKLDRYSDPKAAERRSRAKERREARQEAMVAFFSN